MFENARQVPRPRGRPQIRPDCDTLHLMIEAAAQEFSAKGYAATCMAAVAERAGISTKTMYRLVPTKAELFRNVVADRTGQFMLAIDADAHDSRPLTDGLERILQAYGELTLDAKATAMMRLVLGEGHQFPELASTFYEAAVLRVSEAMASWLRKQEAAGLIKLEDAYMAAGMLRGMMSMEPQRAVMLGQRGAPDHAEIVARAKSCTRIFLDGCRLAPNA
jgi:AcrR family transcriptional regulator